MSTESISAADQTGAYLRSLVGRTVCLDRTISGEFCGPGEARQLGSAGGRLVAVRRTGETWGLILEPGGLYAFEPFSGYFETCTITEERA